MAVVRATPEVNEVTQESPKCGLFCPGEVQDRQAEISSDEPKSLH